MSLGTVLSRVLAREGLRVARAANAAEALRLVETNSPRLALVDQCSRETDNQKLVEEFQTRYPNLPLIVLTDDPPRACESPSAAVERLPRYLTKPINLPDLRQAVEVALATGTKNQEPISKNQIPNSKFQIRNWIRFSKWRLGSWNLVLGSWNLAFGTWNWGFGSWNFAKELAMRVVPVPYFKTAGIIVLILVVLAGFGMLMGGIPAPWQASAAEKPATPPRKTENLPVKLVPGKLHTLEVPEDARKALGISTPKGDFTAIAKKPTKTRPLVMPGSTMLDPTRLYRIRARFSPSPSSAECIEIGQVRDESSPVTAYREIRSGDRVKKDQFLAAFHSVDVGNKKNDLIDAIYQLDLDQQILKQAEEHADAVPKVFLWNALRQVQGDINSVNRALATLRTWGIPDHDIDAVLAEAEKVKKRKGEHDKEIDKKWPRVEVTAPDDGVIGERNLAIRENIVDNTTNLFQIARVDRLAVVANCPEDELPELEKLTTAQRRWTVQTVGSPPVAGLIDDISYIIDPNQHTAVVKGHIDNPKEVLRAGQFITATVELPPPADVVEVPIDAVSEDGQQAVVFVITDAAKHHYMMRRVQLEARFTETAFVRSKPFDKSVQPTKQEQQEGILPLEPLRPGELVLQTGAGELKAKLIDLESQPDKK
jgi:cobalt-zinc-cadmium efflux system membrane fusion protein